MVYYIQILYLIGVNRDTRTIAFLRFFFLKVAFFFLVFLGGGRVDFILNDLLFFVWFCLVVVVVVGTRTEPRTLYNANEHILYY